MPADVFWGFFFNIFQVGLQCEQDQMQISELGCVTKIVIYFF